MDTPAISQLLNPIDIASFAASLPAKIAKDEKRLRLFGVALTKKSAEIALAFAHNTQTPGSAYVTVNGVPIAPTVDTVAQFGKDLADVLGEYEEGIEAMNPRKWSFASVGKDPFVDARAKIRIFAKKWGLDAAFVEAMG